MIKIISKLLAAVAFVGWTGSASAVLITQTYDFTAFFPAYPDSAGTNLFGTVTVTFDDAITVTTQISNITLNSISMPLDSAISWEYSVSGNWLGIGGSSGGATGFDGSVNNDFYFIIGAPSTGSPTYLGAGLSLAGQTGTVAASSGSVTVSAVPLPAAAWLFGSGLICLAGITRKRKAT